MEWRGVQYSKVSSGGGEWNGVKYSGGWKSEVERIIA